MKLEPTTQEEMQAVYLKSRGNYDQLIDEFMESEMYTARVDGEGKTFMSMRAGFHNALRRHINIPCKLVEIGENLYLVKKENLDVE